jgi:hypothetical protein
MFVWLYPDKYFPAPAVRVVILARTAHAGFAKAKVKAQSKTKTTFVSFGSNFFQKVCGVWGNAPRPATVCANAYNNGIGKNKKA